MNFEDWKLKAAAPWVLSRWQTKVCFVTGLAYLCVLLYYAVMWVEAVVLKLVGA